MLLRNNLVNLFFIFVGLLYYIPFVNKGIVLYDEGYYLHVASRILSGDVPYKDFFLQFSPGYFYLLSLLFKIFGDQVIIGRLLTLFICLVILFFELKISERFGFIKIYQKLLIFISTIAFGFPLINNPSILAWISVVLSLGLIYSYLFWYEKQNLKRLFIISLCLTLIFFTKQNLGLYFFVLTNIFVFLSSKKRKLINIVYLDVFFFLPTFIWIYLFLIRNNVIYDFINFNKNYLNIYRLSYPPLSYLLEPVGIFKLIPYYSPILLGVLVVYSLKARIDTRRFYLICISLVGYFGTVLPTSDLLHVYPFYALILISGLIYLNNHKFYRLWILIVIISTAIGFYLTLAREYYRYQPPYYLQNTYLNIPRARGIQVDKPLAMKIDNIYSFLNRKTLKNDYIFSYPFSPMIYFLSERKNPSKYVIYYSGYLTNSEETLVIKELSYKKVKYIVTTSEFRFKTKLSKYIQRQDLIYDDNYFRIFQIK